MSEDITVKRNENISGSQKTEIANRIKGMTEDEQKAVVKMLPSDLMWDELKRRDESNREMISNIRSMMKISK